MKKLIFILFIISSISNSLHAQLQFTGNLEDIYRNNDTLGYFGTEFIELSEGNNQVWDLSNDVNFNDNFLWYISELNNASLVGYNKFPDVENRISFQYFDSVANQFINITNQYRFYDFISNEVFVKGAVDINGNIISTQKYIKSNKSGKLENLNDVYTIEFNYLENDSINVNEQKTYKLKGIGQAKFPGESKFEDAFLIELINNTTENFKVVKESKDTIKYLTTPKHDKLSFYAKYNSKKGNNSSKDKSSFYVKPASIKKEIATGIKENINSNESLYFNQESNKIINNSSSITGKLFVYNILGNIVYQGDVQNEISLSNLNSGVYIAKIINNNQTQKIVKFVKN